MADKSLSDITVENRVEDKKAQISSMIKDIRIEGEYVLYRTLDSDEWRRLSRIYELIDKQPDRIIDDGLVASDDIIGSLEELRHRILRHWDSEVQMFELEKRLDDDGDLEKLTLPFNTKYTEDIVIDRIYDDSGNFIAGHIEDELDGEVHRLWDMELYTKSPKSRDIFAKNGKMSYTEKLQNQINSTRNSLNLSTLLFQTMISGIITFVSLSVMLPFVYLYGIMGFLIWLSFVTVGMVPLIGMVVFLSDVLLYASAARKYLNEDNIKMKPLFTRENS